MNTDELRVRLEQLAANEPPVDGERLDGLVARERRRRARLRWSIGGTALLLVLGMGAAVWDRSTPEPRVEVGARPGPSSTAPRDLPDAHIDLPSRVLSAGSRVTVDVVVTNDTGHPVSVVACDSLFAAVLAGAGSRQSVGWNDCARTFTVPTGRSTFPATIFTSASECSTHGEEGLPACTSNAAGGSALTTPPLAAGDYELSLVPVAGLAVHVPAPMTVRITSVDCAADGASTLVPDVVGRRLPDALRRIRRSGFEVVGFGTSGSDPTASTARVTAQEPGGGERVARGSCIGLRTQ